jgi:hypothetical protein
MKNTGKDQAIYCADSPHLSVRPDLWHNLIRAQESEIHEGVKTEERTQRENDIIQVMKEMIETGELTFTPDGRAILRYPKPDKNNHSICYIEISEDFSP